MSRRARLLPSFLVAAAFILPPAMVRAGDLDDPDVRRMWVGVGLGGGKVKSLAPAPAAGSGLVSASVEIGYRLQPNWGFGMELGAIGPTSGCEEWNCGASPESFAPNFSRVIAFGEFRPNYSGLRIRAGFGMSRFCHERHWDSNGWSPFDFVMALIDDNYLLTADGGSGAWRCDAARHALGGSVSIGYDWRVGGDSPLLMGVRLSAEGANYSNSRNIDVPKFRHRAVMLSLQMQLN